MFQKKRKSHATGGAAKRSHFAALSAILAIFLGWGSTAEARTEKIRWTHPATDIIGFRVYLNANANALGSLIEDLSLAEAGPNQAGEYFVFLDVSDQATVHITVTAYNDENVESFHSNKRAYAPPPPPDADGDGVPDAQDDFPNDSSETVDSDGDGVGDNADAFPNDPTQFEIVTLLSPYRVNAGETADRVLSDGRTWTRDVGFWNTGVAGAIDSSIGIAATSFDEMYRSSRTDTQGGAEMLWSFPLTNGSYSLSLHFAEHSFTAAGQRFFDVEIEDVPVLDDFDIFAAAGNAQYRAVVRSFTVTVTDGVLEVLFLHRPGGANPTVMGIEVVSNEADEGPILTTPGKPFLIDVN